MNEPAPESLAATGSALWAAVVKDYDLRADELRVLAGACAAEDRRDELNAAWREMGRPFMSKGSTGQEVIHPLLGEIRMLEAHVASLAARLKLPDLDAGSGANQNRDAANASWQPGVRGRGA